MKAAPRQKVEFSKFNPSLFGSQKIAAIINAMKNIITAILSIPSITPTILTILSRSGKNQNIISVLIFMRQLGLAIRLPKFSASTSFAVEPLGASVDTEPAFARTAKRLVLAIVFG